MNYDKSKSILEKIKKSQKILLNCHKWPDPDSIGCALALSLVLEEMGKEVEVYCPTGFDDTLSFLKGFGKIKKQDFGRIDFSDFDLFITLDSSSWDFATGLEGNSRVGIPVIVIDHHRTNENYGEINLVDKKLVSCAELLFLIFKDWGVEIDINIATALLAGIIGDTGVFRFPGVTAETFAITTELMGKGADKDKIVFCLQFSLPFKQFKFWGEVLKVLKLDKKHKIAWAAVPYEVFKKYEGSKLKESAATMFFQSVKGSNFGIVMVEEEKGRLNVSFRSRTGVDVSQIALRLGGGGHQYAAGTEIVGLPFAEAVEKVLTAAYGFAEK